MFVHQWFIESVECLAKAGISTSRLDCLVLLEDCLKKDRTFVLAHPEFELTKKQLSTLSAQIARRMRHEPLSYIRGKTEFYGREFMVNRHTLEPRPETETMIELLKQLITDRQSLDASGTPTNKKSKTSSDKPLVVDIGTGSGCLAVTAKLELPLAHVIATDISPECIKLAKQNAINLGADIEFYQGDLLQPLPTTHRSRLTVILANLPYVPDSHTVNKAAMFEPTHAIFGGVEGLDLYRRLFSQIKGLKNRPQYILSESLPFQHQKLVEIAKSVNYKLEKSKDFIQLFKQD